MAKKEDSSREIAELLAELREQNESAPAPAPEPATKKAKNMTDEDVKAMLRRYYSDVDTLPQEKAPSFELDTSDFEPIEPLEVEADERPKKPRSERKKPTPKPEVVEDEPETVEAEPEVVEDEPEVVEDEPEVVEAEPEVVEDEPEVVEDEPEVVEAEPEVVEDEPEIVEDEPEVVEDEPEVVEDEPEVVEDEPEVVEDIDEEGVVDEILYDITDIGSDTTEQLFAIEELEESDDDGEAPIASDVPEALAEPTDEAEAEPEPVENEPQATTEGTDTESEEVEEEVSSPEPEEVDTAPEELAAEPEALEAEDRCEPEFDDELVLVDHPVLPDDEDSREWRPMHDVSGRSDDGELDLMVALGLGDKLLEKYGDERVRRAEEKLRLREERERLEINAHGYTGTELTPRSDHKKVDARYAAMQKRLTIKLIGTVALTAVLFFFENLRLFGISLGGLFESTSFRALIPMLLLCGIAAISYNRLVEAFLFAIGRRRRGNVILPIALCIMLVYDLTIILSFPESAVALYNFPMALGFIFELFSELFDLVRERRVFALLTDVGRGGLYGLSSLGNDERDRDLFSADAIPFVEGYFRRSSDNRRSYPMQMLLTILPLAAGGALLAIVSSVVGIEPVRAVGSFPAVFACASPLALVFNRSWQSLRATFMLADKRSGVIGGVAAHEYCDARCVVFDDELAFPSSMVEIKNIKLYDHCDIYNSIYNVNALFQKAGGPLRELMQFTARELGQPKSVAMTAAGDHYVEALVDGKRRVCAGSYSALTLRGIEIERNPADSHDSEDACVMYAAIDGVACARFCVRYRPNERFLKAAKLLAAEGIGIRLRTLDPNLDRALLVSLFGDRIDAGVRREPARSHGDEPCGTSVIARGDSLALAEPLVVGRRLSRAEQKLALAGLLQLMAGVVVATLLIFLRVPSYMLSAVSGAIQLLGVLPAVVIYSLNVKR